MLTVGSLKKSFLSTPLFKDVSFSIVEGDHIGLVGSNGCGKSTILKILMGLEEPDEGDINIQRGIKLGYVPQQPEYTQDITVAQELKKAFPALLDMERQMDMLLAAGDDKSHAQYDRLMEKYEREGGYQYENKLAAFADQLGLTPKLNHSIRTLSGGEKNIMELTKAVATEPDILVLDEPGNHLDFKGLEKLEYFLRCYNRAFIMVAHDRYLLDQTVNKVLDLDHGVLSSYTGNYSAYRQQKVQAQLAAQATYENNQKEVKRMEEMVKRFTIWARESGNIKLGRQAKSKQKALERMQKVERPAQTKDIQAEFKVSNRSGLIVLDVKSYEKSFGERILFKNAYLRLHNGDKLALIGPNGCGKSTFIKEVLTQANWENERLRLGPSVKIGYYSQHHADNLNLENTLEQELIDSLNINRQQAHALAGRFGFDWDDLDKKIAPLSGGEKARIQLMKLIGGKSNFLILDEPTNHLDIPAKEKLEEALEAYEGSILFITHDRYFLRRIASRIVVVEDQKLKEFEGDAEESLIYLE